MTTLYFAYGSNLKAERMRDRIPDAAAEGVAHLDGYRLCWDKRGADASGKANLRADPASRVWGVLYAFDAASWSELDAHEPGYRRIQVRVTRGGAAEAAHTYLSRLSTGEPPFEWYKRLVIDGAREHGLPEAWVSALEAFPAQPDR